LGKINKRITVARVWEKISTLRGRRDSKKQNKREDRAQRLGSLEKRQGGGGWDRTKINVRRQEEGY